MSICHKNNSSLTSKLVNGKQILKAAEEIVAFKKNKYYSKDNIRVLKKKSLHIDYKESNDCC